jgi:hypothetical protein
MAVKAKLNAETLIPKQAGEHCFPTCNHVLARLETSSQNGSLILITRVSKERAITSSLVSGIRSARAEMRRHASHNVGQLNLATWSSFAYSSTVFHPYCLQIYKRFFEWCLAAADRWTGCLVGWESWKVRHSDTRSSLTWQSPMAAAPREMEFAWRT